MQDIYGRILRFKNRRALSASIKNLEKHLELEEELRERNSFKSTWSGAKNSQIIQIKQTLKILRSREELLHR